MLFHTQYFLIFFSIVFGIYWLLPKASFRRVFLLISSLVFYAFWSIPLITLLLISCSIDFFAGRKVWETQKKKWIVLSLVTNLGILAYFKYVNFGIQSLITVAQAVGVVLPIHTLSIVLPLGISFYTFQSMSYTIDMARRKYKPYDSFLNFSLYVTFFPQLIAGPIVRGNHFYKQCHRRLPLRWHLIYQGLILFTLGVFKKVVLADQSAVFATAIFSNPTQYTSFLTVVGIVCFSFQIYFDFSAYTDMARGLGYFLGFRLPENFFHPYSAIGIRDFWRRWHVSLSTWLRDYLYIPLGGSRKGLKRMMISLGITMFLGGLWHGSSWNFVVWGSIHGVLLMIENLWTQKQCIQPQSVFFRSVLRVITYSIICFTWVFFRAQTFPEALQVFQSLFTLPVGSYFHQFGFFKAQNWLVGVILPCSIIIGSTIHPLDKTLKSYPVLANILFIMVLILLTLLIGGGTSEFIYFQF